MPNYRNGRIYAIRAPGTDEVYIGSTTLPLSQRMVQHRANYTRWAEKQVGNYVTSFKLLERDGAYIELIEEFPCDSKEQLNKREGEIMRTTTGCINKCLAGRTPAEYRFSHKEQRALQSAKYREKNPDKVKEYRKAYRTRRNELDRARYAAKKAAAISQPPVECESSETSSTPGADSTAASTAAQ